MFQQRDAPLQASPRTRQTENQTAATYGEWLIGGKVADPDSPVDGVYPKNLVAFDF